MGQIVQSTRRAVVDTKRDVVVAGRVHARPSRLDVGDDVVKDGTSAAEVAHEPSAEARSGLHGRPGVARHDEVVLDGPTEAASVDGSEYGGDGGEHGCTNGDFFVHGTFDCVEVETCNMILIGGGRIEL